MVNDVIDSCNNLTQTLSVSFNRLPIRRVSLAQRARCERSFSNHKNDEYRMNTWSGRSSMCQPCKAEPANDRGRPRQMPAAKPTNCVKTNYLHGCPCRMTLPTAVVAKCKMGLISHLIPHAQAGINVIFDIHCKRYHRRDKTVCGGTKTVSIWDGTCGYGFNSLFGVHTPWKTDIRH